MYLSISLMNFRKAIPFLEKQLVAEFKNFLSSLSK